MRYVAVIAVISLVLVAEAAAGQVSGVSYKRVTAVRTDERPELDGLWARRGLIVERFRALIDERGEDQVLF